MGLGHSSATIATKPSKRKGALQSILGPTSLQIEQMLWLILLYDYLLQQHLMLNLSDTCSSQSTPVKSWPFLLIWSLGLQKLFDLMSTDKPPSKKNDLPKIIQNEGQYITQFYPLQLKYQFSFVKTLEISKLAVRRSKTQEISY